MYVYHKEHLQLQHVHHELHRETYFAFHAKVYHDTRYSEPENETKLKLMQVNVVQRDIICSIYFMICNQIHLFKRVRI